MRKVLDGLLVVSMALTVGCGESHSTGDGGGRDAGGARDAGDHTDGGGTGGPCPASAPEADSACTREGLVCEYGPRSCLVRAECDGGQWARMAPIDCPEPPTAGCPATRAEAQGTACPGEEGAVCEYDSLLCSCTTCPNPYPLCMLVDPPVWACEAPNPDSACPAAQPLLGSPCAMEDQTCDYGCEAGRRRLCADGVWTSASAPGGCPVSSRRFKRDVHYLDADEVEALGSEVLQTRLATYRYSDPALAGGTHLGFIIEDQPYSYAVDPERSQVDLYGYTSMLVAAMQAQQRRIDELEREVRDLRRRCRD
jgi:hypothetical protein